MWLVGLDFEECSLYIYLILFKTIADHYIMGFKRVLSCMLIEYTYVRERIQLFTKVLDERSKQKTFI